MIYNYHDIPNPCIFTKTFFSWALGYFQCIFNLSILSQFMTDKNRFLILIIIT